MDLTRIYKCIPYLLILLAIGATVYLLTSGKSEYLFNTSTIFIIAAFIIGSLIIIFAKKNHPESISLDVIACLNIPQRTLRRCFIIAASLLLIVVLLGFWNSFIYILLLIAACICIILQMLSKNVSAPWAIFEILYVAGILIFPLIFAYPYYFSDSDIIYHTYFAQTIIDTGFLDTFAASGGIYATFPGYHLLLAGSSLLSALPANVCDYIVVKLGLLGLSIFVYLLVRQFFPSKTAGLLALFIYLIGAFALPRYTWGQPSVLLAAFALLLLYLVFRKKTEQRIPFIILAIPVILFALITHHANHLPLIGILLVILLTDLLIIPLISRHASWREHSTNISIILMYILPAVAYLWFTYSSSMLRLIDKIISTVGTAIQTLLDKGVSMVIQPVEASPVLMTGTAGNTVTALSSVSTDFSVLNTVYNWLSSSYIWLCIIPALVGMYFLLTGTKTSRKQYLLGFVMLVFFILFAASGGAISALDALNIYRFYNIIAALFMGGIVFGLIYLVIRLQHKCNKKYLSQCIVGIFCLLLLVSSCVVFAADNDILQPLKIAQNNPDQPVNNHFSETDMAMFDTMKGILPSKTYYTADHRALRYINTFVSEAKTGANTAPHAIIMDNIFSKDCISDGSYKKYGLVFFRENHFLERGLYTYNNEKLTNFFATPETISRVNSNLHMHNAIYTNGENQVYGV